MRTKARRYAASVPAATMGDNTHPIGITGDFEGGHVVASATIGVTPGVGNWATAQFHVDGVPQGLGSGGYQSGLNLTIAFAATLRVPQGRHRITVRLGSNAQPMANSAADMTVAELNG